MGALLGMTAGVGLFLIWWSCWQAEPRKRSGEVGLGFRRLRELLKEADLSSVSVTAFLALCAVAGIGTGLAVLAVTGVLSVATCFAMIAGWAPWAAVRGRARRRRQRFRELWPDVVDNLASGVGPGSPFLRRWVPRGAWAGTTSSAISIVRSGLPPDR